MVKNISEPSTLNILVDCRAIRKAWSEREQHRRQDLAARKQMALVNLLFRNARSTPAHVA